MVYRKRNGILERLPYIQIFPGQVSQDASITVAIILDVISSLVRKYPTLHEINLWLDNGGCYKSSETMSTLFHHTTHVKTYNFCETQDGKGACERISATITSGIRRYVNDGHNVVTAQQMKLVSLKIIIVFIIKCNYSHIEMLKLEIVYLSVNVMSVIFIVSCPLD